MTVRSGHGVGVHAQDARVREFIAQLFLHLLRPRAHRAERSAAVRTPLRHRFRVSAVVAHEPVRYGMIRQIDAAPRTARRVAAVHADEAAAVAAPVQKQNGLIAADNRVAQPLLERRAHDPGVSLPQLLLQVDQLHARHCLPVEAFFQGVERKIAALRVVHRLDRRRRRPEYDQSPSPQPAIERDLARMVARRVLRFIGVLLLLIQNEETGVFYRRKYRRPRPYDDARPPLADAPPLVKPRADL